MWHPGAEAGVGYIVHPGRMDALLSFCGNKELGEGVCLFRLSLSLVFTISPVHTSP
jgi:hypothetical protein